MVNLAIVFITVTTVENCNYNFVLATIPWEEKKIWINFITLLLFILLLL